MESKFYRHKMSNHPHMNMEELLLNMLARESSYYLEKQYKIRMNYGHNR